MSRIGSAEKPMKASYIVFSMRPKVQPEAPARRRWRSYSTTSWRNPVQPTSANVMRLFSRMLCTESTTLRSASRKLPVAKREPRGMA